MSVSSFLTILCMYLAMHWIKISSIYNCIHVYKKSKETSILGQLIHKGEEDVSVSFALNLKQVHLNVLIIMNRNHENNTLHLCGTEIKTDIKSSPYQLNNFWRNFWYEEFLLLTLRVMSSFFLLSQMFWLFCSPAFLWCQLI